MGEENNKELTRARNTAYRLLTYRPRSRKELEQKLRDREYSPAVIASVLEHCVRLGYLNDRTFAEQWARSRIMLRMFGRRRIEQELRYKGIDREIVREVLAEAFGEGQEIETAKLAAKKKNQAMKSVDRETGRRRLAGFLERKGFSSEVIRMVLRRLDKTDRDRSD